MTTIEVKVTHIGDLYDVPVIEVLVRPGDMVAKEASIVTLESDKATMDVPSQVVGTVKELKFKVGDKVSECTLILTVESGAAAAEAPKLGYKPDIWVNTMELGVARRVGQEPVIYVRNIYKYYVAYNLQVETLEARRAAEAEHAPPPPPTTGSAAAPRQTN